MGYKSNNEKTKNGLLPKQIYDLYPVFHPIIVEAASLMKFSWHWLCERVAPLPPIQQHHQEIAPLLFEPFAAVVIHFKREKCGQQVTAEFLAHIPFEILLPHRGLLIVPCVRNSLHEFILFFTGRGFEYVEYVSVVCHTTQNTEAAAQAEPPSNKEEASDSPQNSLSRDTTCIYVFFKKSVPSLALRQQCHSDVLIYSPREYSHVADRKCEDIQRKTSLDRCGGVTSALCGIIEDLLPVGRLLEITCGVPTVKNRWVSLLSHYHED